MKIRNFNDISVVDNGDDTLTFKHLTGEMQLPCDGGAYVVVAECGVGKSTGITEMVKLFPKEAFAIFERTKADCDEARIRLIRSGVMPHEIIVLHGDSSDYPRLHNDPERVSQSRIVIAPHIHLYTDFRPAFFTYDGGRRIDLEPYVAGMTKLMKSDIVRRFILIDEAPDFVVPFVKFNGVEMTNTYSHYSSKCGRYGVDVDGSGKAFLNPMSQEQMERLYFSRVKKTPMTLFKDSDPHAKLKIREALHYIRQNFREVAYKVNELRYHNLNDLVQHGSKANIYLFDATGAVLSNYRKSRFRPIRSSGKSYSSPIAFEKFTMKVDRWKHESVADASTIAAEVALMADEIERQISTITGNTGLLDAVNANSRMTVIISDNLTTAMTGGQHSAGLNKYESICQGLGVDPNHIKVVVPLPKNMEEIEKILREEIEYEGLSVIIPRRECIQTMKKSKK